MTAIRRRLIEERGSGILGVHSLDRFSLIVPDLKIAKDFYEAFGLTVSENGNALDLRACGSNHVWGTIVEGERKRMHHLSYGVFEEDLERFKEHLEGMGVRLIDGPRSSESNGIWFSDPDGNLVELKVAEKVSPDQKNFGSAISSPAGIPAAPTRGAAPLVAPSRLAHMLIFSSDVPRSIEFYGRALGLGLSDRAGDNIAFMHGRHGSDHHMIAFAKSNGSGIHHTSWDVPNVNFVGLGAMQMADKGFTDGWGVGRHVLGSNYFHYVRDPWGSYTEYSSDIDYIPADIEWNAGNYADEDAFYIWGPKPPSDFTINHEAEP